LKNLPTRLRGPKRPKRGGYAFNTAGGGFGKEKTTALDCCKLKLRANVQGKINSLSRDAHRIGSFHPRKKVIDFASTVGE